MESLKEALWTKWGKIFVTGMAGKKTWQLSLWDWILLWNKSSIWISPLMSEIVPSSSEGWGLMCCWYGTQHGRVEAETEQKEGRGKSERNTMIGKHLWAGDWGVGWRRKQQTKWPIAVQCVWPREWGAKSEWGKRTCHGWQKGDSVCMLQAVEKGGVMNSSHATIVSGEWKAYIPLKFNG